MTYKRFNKFIHDYFFKDENLGDNIVLCIDDFVITEFCNQCSISKEDLQFDFQKNHYWNNFQRVIAVGENSSIPNYFGFVGIQIYNAYLMHDDDYYTARAYKPRLAEYYDIDLDDVTNIFNALQDEIWQSFKTWAEDKDFDIYIPEPRPFMIGRYVQYPLSQLVLNQDDLELVPLLFKESGLRKGEELSFLDFKDIIENSDRSNLLSGHYYRTKNRLEVEGNVEVLYKQLFSYFNNQWDGEYPVLSDSEEHPVNHIERQVNSLILNARFDEIELLDYNNNLLREYSLKERRLFNEVSSDFKMFHHDALCFTKDELENEWIANRFLSVDNPNIIICDKISPESRLIGELDEDYIDHSNSFYSIFEINVTGALINHYYWSKYFSKQSKTYFVENGLKLERDCWMYGAGPTLRFTKKEKAWINGERIEFENSNLIFNFLNESPGIYRLKVKGFTPYKFEIISPLNIDKINEIHIGWEIQKKDALWRFNENDYNITGLATYFNTQSVKSNTRTWINANKSKLKVKVESSIVINAIIRSKYGI